MYPSGSGEGRADSSHREAEGSGGSESRCVELLRERAPLRRADEPVLPLWASVSPAVGNRVPMSQRLGVETA